MQRSYLFYDIETTGLNKSFDQILQFGAIRTDLDFNILDEHEIQIRLNPDIIPAPEALITNRISLKDLQKGELEIDALKKIHALFNTPGSISLGYNTLGFDDEFLRFSFYRNLFPPYTHQYANHCGRMDIFPMVVLYYLFKPEILNWPKNEGKISLKLADISTENHLAEGPAHTAIVDVRATLELSKKLASSKAMWEFVCGYFNKETDLARIHKLRGEALLIQPKIGYDHNYIAPVLSLGQHYHYKNQTLWLRLDHAELSKTKMDNVPEKTYVYRKKLSECPLLLPLQDRYLEKISPDRLALVNENKKWLSKNPDILREIQEYHRNFIYPAIPNIDIDAALYEIGFPSQEEELLFKRFHEAKPEHKIKIAEQFPNPKRKIQAYRIMGRFYPEYSNETALDVFQEYLAHEKIIDYRNEEKLTLEEAQKRIKALQKSNTLDSEQIQILEDYSSLPLPLRERDRVRGNI